jgi:dihydrofolate synthase/folylpolyglutamate synthase
MAAFAQIDQARGDTSLSYFEFATLAALVCFSHQPLDIIILEVGLGGRLDAVNIVDGDVAIISSIGLDHQAYLGHTREAIGLEKAGVIRRGKPVVIGDPDIPAKVVQRVQQVGASLYRQGIEFTCQQQVASWRWQGQTINGQPLSYPKLPLPKLAVQNAATSLQALALLALPVEPEAMTQGLEKVRLAGRLEMVAAAVPILLDVAHNSQAVAQLAGYLVANPVQGSNLAVFSALADKDVAQMISQLAPLIDSWYVAGLQVNRGLSTNQLITSVKQSVQASAKQPVTGYSDINQAYQGALAQAKPEDRLVVFGSFYTVAAIKRLLSAND